jgi:hypothetical protein
MQFHLVQPDLHAKAGGMFGHGSVRGKQRQWQGAIPLRIERFDSPAPTLALTVVDLAQIQHRTLHHLAARATPTLDDAPVTMFLAVFEPSVALQEHDSHRSYSVTARWEEAGSILQRFLSQRSLKQCGLRGDQASKKSVSPSGREISVRATIEALQSWSMVAELRTNLVRVDSDFSATPFKAKIANAEQLRVHTMLDIGGPHGAKPKAEVIADILASIKDAAGISFKAPNATGKTSAAVCWSGRRNCPIRRLSHPPRLGPARPAARW